MKHVMEVKGHKAVVEFDADIGMFRGEFLGLNGGADFYADNVAGLAHEGEKSLSAFLELVRKKVLNRLAGFPGVLTCVSIRKPMRRP